MTHKKLVDIGRCYLSNKLSCPVVMTEVVSYAMETPDCWGCNTGGKTFLIEAKTSKQDFKKDKKKSFRKYPLNGLGNFRYYLCSNGLINVSEVPPSWGLLWANESREVIIKKHPEYQESSNEGENILMLSVLRRLGIQSDKECYIKTYKKQLGKEATLTVME